MTEKFLATLREYAKPFYIPRGNPTDLSESDYETATLSREEIGEKVAEADRVLVF